jgi:hypothetical protein
MMTLFLIDLPIACPACSLHLRKIEDGTLLHEGLGCTFSGQRFYAPMIQLQPVAPEQRPVISSTAN